MDETFREVIVRGAPFSETQLLLVLLQGCANCEDNLVKHVDNFLELAHNTVSQVTAVLLRGDVLESGGHRSWWLMPCLDDVHDVEMFAKKVIPPEAVVRRLTFTLKQQLERCSDPPVLILGGFDQGASLAVHSFAKMRADGIAISALFVISGFVDTNILQTAAEMCLTQPSVRLFLAHGEEDDQIPELIIHKCIRVIKDLKHATSSTVELQTFFHEGGHEVGDGTMRALASWLPKVAGEPRASVCFSDSNACSHYNTMMQGLEMKQHGSADDECTRKSAEAHESLQLPVINSEMFRKSSPVASLDKINMISAGKGSLQIGTVVRLKGFDQSTHLNGARGTLEAWDKFTGHWEVEMLLTHARMFARPENVERHISEEERRRRTAIKLLGTPSPEEVADLREANISPVFDAPAIHQLLWQRPPSKGKGLLRSKDTLTGINKQADAGDVEFIEIGDVPCLVVGPVDYTAKAPVALLFHGYCEEIAANMLALARAYAECIAGRAIVPLEAPKASFILAHARALVKGIRPELGSGPLIVHGIFGGSIAAVQIAAEQSQSAIKVSRCRLLVLEHGIASVDNVPGLVGVIGGLQNDPFGQALKLKMVRAPIILIRGTPEAAPYLTKDPVELVADKCPVTPLVLHEPSALTRDKLNLVPELRTAAWEETRLESQ